MFVEVEEEGVEMPMRPSSSHGTWTNLFEIEQFFVPDEGERGEVVQHLARLFRSGASWFPRQVRRRDVLGFWQVLACALSVTSFWVVFFRACFFSAQ